MGKVHVSVQDRSLLVGWFLHQGLLHSDRYEAIRSTQH